MKAFLIKFSEFLVPEKGLSAKLVFDNVRNYLICAAFFALTNWFQRGAPNVPFVLTGPSFQAALSLLANASLWAGAALLVINAFQSGELFRRAVDSIGKAFLAVTVKLGNHQNAGLAIFGLLSVLLSMLAFLVLSLVLTAWGTIIIGYLIAFTAIGSHAP